MTEPAELYRACDRCGSWFPEPTLTYRPGPTPQYGDVGEQGQSLCDECLEAERAEVEREEVFDV